MNARGAVVTGTLWGFGVLALFAWHVAVVVTTGADFTYPRAGLDAVYASIRMTKNAHGAAPVTVVTLAVWVGSLVTVVIGLGVIVLVRSKSRAGGVGTLASAKDLQRSVTPRRSIETTQPFARLNGRDLRLRTEDNGAVVGPPRMGKTMYLVMGLITDASGAVVATGTKPEVYRLTAFGRSQLGRVFVVDPEGVSPWPDKARWDIVAGCEVDEEAQERADALVGSRDLGEGGNAQFFQEAASTVLRCLLHAAALKPGGSMRDVLRWSRDFSDEEPYEILRNHPAAKDGWIEDLKKFCRGDAHETVSSTDMSLGLVLKCFGLGNVLETVCPPRGSGFDPSKHYQTKDTIYLLSRSGKTSLAAPVITALVTAIERAARLAAGHTATGRIDVPMTMVLDEVANVAPVRDLASLMSDGGGRGVLVWPFVQSRQQLAQRYGREDAKTILDSASAFLMLSGSKDFDHLKELSDLAGMTRVERTSHSTSSGNSGNGGSTQHSTEREALLAPERIRTMGTGKALMFYRDQAPAIVDLVPWWDRRDKSQFEESIRWTRTKEGLANDAAEVTKTVDFLKSATLAEDAQEAIA